MIIKHLIGLMIVASFTGSSLKLFSILGFSITLFDVILLTNIFVLFFLSGNKSRIIVRRNILNILIIGIVCIFLTLIFCVDIGQWIKGIVNTVKIIFCMFVVIKHSITENDVKYFRKCYMYGVALTLIVSIYEIVTGVHLFTNYALDYISDEWMYNELLKAPTAFLYNPNNVACVVALGLPWNKYLLPLKLRDNLFAQLFLQVISLFVVFKTGSRGGILVGVVLIIISILIEGKDIKHILRYTFMGMIVLVCICIKYKDFLLEQLAYASFATTGEFSIFIKADIGRLGSIVEALQIFIQTLGIGCGPWCYEVFHQKIYGDTDSVHFFLVELLACYGIVPTILFLGFFIKTVIKFYRIKRWDLDARNYMWIMLAWIVLSIIPPTIFTLYVFWFALSICIAYSNIKQKEVG